MLSESQYASNRKSARNVVAYNMGLDINAVSDWTYNERSNFVKALAQYIIAHPASFAESDIVSAKHTANKNYGELVNDDFDFLQFGAETIKPALDAAKSVGDGVLTTVNAAKWVIPVVAAVVVIGGLYWLNAKAKTL